MAVLIFSMPGDLHTAAVEWALQKKGIEVEKIFLSDFPQRGTISCTNAAGEIRFNLGPRAIRYDEYDTIWFRRISSAVPSPSLVPGDLTAAKRGWSELSRYLIEFPRQKDSFCLNPPESFGLRDNKVHQLNLAQQCGLTIPPTLISTRQEDLAEFILENSREGHQTIAKPLVRTLWNRNDGTSVMLTISVVNIDDLAEADVSSEPLIFQRRIEKAFEVRLTVMGCTMFAVKLDSQSDPKTQLDFRDAPDWRVLGHESIPVPSHVRAGVERLCDELVTPFGTMDFIVTPQGDWVFLETNTMGNFLWMEDCNPELPLLDCFAELLISKDRRFVYGANVELPKVRFREFKDDSRHMKKLDEEYENHVEYVPQFAVNE